MKNEKFLLEIQKKCGDIANKIPNAATDAERTFKCKWPKILKIKSYLVHQSLPGKRQCVYCNSYALQNLCMLCILHLRCYKMYFHIFNVNKVTQHVNYTCLLFWKCYFAYY